MYGAGPAWSGRAAVKYGYRYMVCAVTAQFRSVIPYNQAKAKSRIAAKEIVTYRVC